MSRQTRTVTLLVVAILAAFGIALREGFYRERNTGPRPDVELRNAALASISEQIAPAEIAYFPNIDKFLLHADNARILEGICVIRHEEKFEAKRYLVELMPQRSGAYRDMGETQVWEIDSAQVKKDLPSWHLPADVQAQVLAGLK